jgi:type III pantothenate kinase
MLLCIDVGNTNIVFAIFEHEVLRGQWRMSTISHRTSDEYAAWLHQILTREGIAFEAIKGAILSTVVPDTQFAMITLCRQYFNVTPLIVGEKGMNVSMPVCVDKPQEVGADRLVNAVEAWRRYQRALVVVDFGTATTFDVVSSRGEYLGGVIAPGVNLSLMALHQAAAKLPSIRVRQPEKVIGTNTVSAMESGVFYGYLAMVDGIVGRIREEYGEPVKVIATGGLATLYARHSTTIEETVSDLTIYGLDTIYTMNCNI